ncbi:MAG TPA: hypothetical protein VJR03_16835 [Nitrospira sp.]|nr:hypothetical protein [Nitrospira sp.]
MPPKSNGKDERTDHTRGLRQVVSIFLLWAIPLLLAGAFVNAESVGFLDGQIQFYPAQRAGDRILIPFAQPPGRDNEVLLLYHRTDLFHLRRLQKKTIMPNEMANPRPHYVYGPTDGQLVDSQAQFLVAVGKRITPLLKWKAAETMSDQQLVSSCMAPEQGFAITGLQVLAAEALNAKVYYLQEESLPSTVDKFINENNDSGSSIMREIVGMVGPEGSCHVLAYHTSDPYGLHRTGTSEPIGPIFGIIEMSGRRSTERWLVLRSARQEVWGYTFIELLPLPWNREPKRRFLLEDRA